MNDQQLEQQMIAALRAERFGDFETLAAEAQRRHDAREQRLNAPTALAASAAFYAQRGIAVFPLQPRDKKPYPGSRGFKDATTNVDIVRRWWNDKPQSNIGLPTGHGFDVIDVDGPEGYHSYADLRDRDMLPAILGRAFTQRGMHLYIPSTGDGNTTALLPGIDYRGIGGYVVAPPSIGDTGKRYDWLEPIAQLAAPAVAA